jgi:7,8-dihydro-6-hydroxymethylpterin-pyrophosphokinase
LKIRCAKWIIGAEKSSDYFDALILTITELNIIKLMDILHQMERSSDFSK